MKLSSIKTVEDAKQYVFGEDSSSHGREMKDHVFSAVLSVEALRQLRMLQAERDRAGDAVGRQHWARTAGEWSDTRMTPFARRIARNEGLLP